MAAISSPVSSSTSFSPVTSSNDVGGLVNVQRSQHTQWTKSKASTDSKSAAIPKPRLSKSRNGCSTCKAKRLKCDETKPTCNQCTRRKVVCGGYKKDFKWRAFVDTSPHSLTWTGSEKSWSKEDADSTATPALSDQGSTSSSYGASSTVQIHVLTTPNSSHSPELTFPTPEQLLEYPNHSPRIEFQNLKDVKADAIHAKTTVHSYIPNANTVKDHITSGPLSEQITAQYPPCERGQEVEEENVEEISRSDKSIENTASIQAYSSSSSSSQSSGVNLSFIFNQPRLVASSPEMLALNFDRNTCGILSVRDGVSENPWRTLIWPLAKDSPPLYHAIASLSAFHCSASDHQMKFTGMNHMSQSISQLYQNINNMNIEQSLATSIALALADTWDTSISTGIEHVRGGSILISNALVKMKKQKSLKNRTTLRFLCKTWLYMDVLSRLTSTQIDDADWDCPLWSQIDLLTNSDEIDPLLGCASTLFPVIGRIANLVSTVRKTRHNSLSLISKANELKQELLNWSPPSYLQTPEDPTCEIQHSIQTAEAYRWATMLYLHQAVPEIPSRSAESIAQTVLLSLATIPIRSRTLIVHIYPLLAASCEASTPDDRAWTVERWTEMRRRMQISNIDRCMEVVKEVWSRRDQALVDAGSYNIISTSDRSQTLRRASIEIQEKLPYERTVRGSQHWAGVMKELAWEVMLG